MKKALLFALPALAAASFAQEAKQNTLTVGFENEYSVPNGHIQIRYANLFSKLQKGWYVNLRLQDIELYRNGTKTFDKNAVVSVGGKLDKNVEFEVLGAPRLSGDRVATWYGGELRFLQGPLVLHAGARRYNSDPRVTDYRLGFDYYWQQFRLAGEVISPDKLGLATWRGWFDWYYDDKGSVVGVFVSGPSANIDYSILGGQQTVMTTILGLRATHMVQDNLGVTAAIELAPVRTLGIGIVIRF